MARPTIHACKSSLYSSIKYYPTPFINIPSYNTGIQRFRNSNTSGSFSYRIHPPPAHSLELVAAAGYVRTSVFKFNQLIYCLISVRIAYLHDDCIYRTMLTGSTPLLLLISKRNNGVRMVRSRMVLFICRRNASI